MGLMVMMSRLLAAGVPLVGQVSMVRAEGVVFVAGCGFWRAGQTGVTAF
jgi:hypothetical protein